MTLSAEPHALTLEAFHTAVRGEALEPLWLQPDGAMTAEPVTPFCPYRWRWRAVRERMLQAGALLPVGKEGAARRVLIFRNPGAPRGAPTTPTLGAAIQLVLPGEQAPSHRHSPAAIRFIIEGRDACTIVDGEPCTMTPGDLILTPSWAWHGHVNAGAGPIFWLDVLDVPLVASLYQFFYEEHPDGLEAPRRAPDASLARYGAGILLPQDVLPAHGDSPLLRYPWAVAEARLRALADTPGDPFDGVLLTYTHPYTGGPVMPTMTCRIQLLRPGERTRAHRHTASVVYHVVRGRGTTIVDGTALDWEAGDVLALPGWVWHEHVNAAPDAEAILFSVSDEPVLRALGLYREESRADTRGA